MEFSLVVWSVLVWQYSDCSVSLTLACLKVIMIPSHVVGGCRWFAMLYGSYSRPTSKWRNLLGRLSCLKPRNQGDILGSLTLIRFGLDKVGRNFAKCMMAPAIFQTLNLYLPLELNHQFARKMLENKHNMVQIWWISLPEKGLEHMGL